jgi:hypothetical protein
VYRLQQHSLRIVLGFSCRERRTRHGSDCTWLVRVYMRVLWLTRARECGLHTGCFGISVLAREWCVDRRRYGLTQDMVPLVALSLYLPIALVVGADHTTPCADHASPCASPCLAVCLPYRTLPTVLARVLSISLRHMTLSPMYTQESSFLKKAPKIYPLVSLLRIEPQSAHRINRMAGC